MDTRQYILEAWVATIPKRNRLIVDVEIFKNPKRTELVKSTNYGSARCFLLGKDMYVWKNAIHAMAAAELGIDSNRSVIPLQLWMDGSTIMSVTVSDYANRTRWAHNKSLKKAILKHPFIRLYGDDLNAEDFVSYYDEAIGGPWHQY